MQIDLNEKKNKQEKILKDTNKFIKTKLGLLGVSVVSLVWLFWGFFTPTFKETPIWILFMSSGVSMVVAYSIGALLRYQGVLTGSSDSELISLKKLHREIVIKSNEYAEYVDEWALVENDLALKLARTHELTSAGLRYSDYFDEKGDYTDKEINPIPKNSEKWVKERYNYKNKKLKEAIEFKVTPVTIPAISSESNVDLDYNNTGLSPEEHLTISNKKAFLKKILTVAIFGLIQLQLGSGNWKESLFNGLAQLIVFLLFGLVGFYSEYTFMTNTYTGNLRKKINLLERLIVYGKKKELEKNIKKQEVIDNERYYRDKQGPYIRQPEEISGPSKSLLNTTSTSSF